VESTGQLKLEAHQLYRLIKRVELLVSDLQPYALRSKSTLEAVFAVLQVRLGGCWAAGLLGCWAAGLGVRAAGLLSCWAV
jgi:hypothetical protein